MHLRAVADGVWTAASDRWSTQSTIVVSGDGTCLVVDPAVTVSDVIALSATIASKGWTPSAGFSTHPHWDHLLWTALLGDVPRWATPACARRASENKAQLLAQAMADAPGHDEDLFARLTPLPDDAGEASGDRQSPSELPWNGPRVLVLPYTAHCVGSAALLLPDSGVLLAGDVLSDTEVPLLDLDSPDPVADHHAAIDLLQDAAERTGVGVMVPGHGTVTDLAGLRRRAATDHAYLEALTSGVPVEDPRLTDPWVAGQHEDQVAWVRSQ